MTRPPDLRRKDPEVRKERVKLIASGLNAIGIALIIGSAVAPIVDASRRTDPLHIVVGFLLGGVFILAAYSVLHYIVPRRR